MNFDLALASRAAVVAAAVIAVLATVALDRLARTDRGPTLRRRLILGVPWGTLAVAAVVLAVYLFVQGGWGHWYNPVVIPFRAWSYLAPVGVAVAGFAHAGPGHLLGNLFGTLAVAPLVEYAVGHFPRRRGSSSFGSVRDNPYARAFLLFPAATIAVGLVSGAFALGPVIGFSGVVFAFVGAALVYYPLGTVVALSASGLLSTTYRALNSPVVEASGRPAYITPWWADIAIQGHALGLLVGVLAAAWLAAARGDDLPRPRRLALGALLVGVEQSLWAVYWYRGGETFVLFRGIGLAAVALLAVFVAALAADRDAPAADTVREALRNLTPRRGSVAVLLVVLAALSGPAVAVNLVAVGDEPLPGDPVEVRGYDVTYAEGVENGMVSVIDVEAFGETTGVTTSGVVVRNPDRGVWTTAVSKGRLAFSGRQRVVLGGVGWREVVTVTRSGWTTVGGDGPAYLVRLTHGGETTLAFLSNASTAEPRIEGRNVSVVPTDSGFQLLVEGDNRSVAAPVPDQNETVTANGLSFVRDGRAVFALAGEVTGSASADNATAPTRVRVATKEQYNGRNG
ncbi:rhomboid family intramembrane serine protease [Halobaculum magnesiiphilum]|uniref:Rhomboid family intramembrane serine protease n=1 Tax=Halobaculum magnesiiphilum TaxID=1017351 RepID=A0A8T8WFJ6_9EURY|nr:rhomboid family intramembrane serine protease [Halobaculum magnesiiphilum]QZP38629.1 rhomboid family intramembrane serine protease [Halobaculum magnesiiphilum]